MSLLNLRTHETEIFRVTIAESYATPEVAREALQNAPVGKIKLAVSKGYGANADELKLLLGDDVVVTYNTGCFLQAFYYGREWWISSERNCPVSFLVADFDHHRTLTEIDLKNDSGIDIEDWFSIGSIVQEVHRGEGGEVVCTSLYQLVCDLTYADYNPGVESDVILLLGSAEDNMYKDYNVVDTAKSPNTQDPLCVVFQALVDVFTATLIVDRNLNSSQIIQRVGVLAKLGPLPPSD